MEIEEIKKYMKQNRITYKKLASMTGLSISTITKIFGGFARYPRIDTIRIIEKAIGLSDTNWTAEDYENGVVDNMPVRITAEESQWLTYREEILRYGGQKDYEAVCVMIEGLIDKRMKEKNIKPITGD